ncbi:hypothetical protein SB4536_410010 [Klebsiella pneumoniae subsp. pneumoniae T69]|nr:hypothetical protein SB4536_410010 [Klebsiella pneumoniae subsp. pneumoniae T69]
MIATVAPSFTLSKCVTWESAPTFPRRGTRIIVVLQVSSSFPYERTSLPHVFCSMPVSPR